MKNIILYGNCQIASLTRILNKLVADKFQIFNLVQIQLIKDPKYFNEVREKFKVADYIIIQNNESKFKDPFIEIIPFINQNTKVIIIDSLYNSIYHPELVSSSDISPFRFGKLHDINVVSAVSKGVPLNDFLANDPFYDETLYEEVIYLNSYKSTIKEIETRQSKLYTKINMQNNISQYKHINIIKYINYIYQNPNIMKISPWNDFNHPSLDVYKYLTKEIFKEIECEFDEKLFNERIQKHVLLKVNRPVYLSTINNFNFSNEKNLYTLGKEFINKTREEYVIEAYEHYSLVDSEILENNVKEYEENLKKLRDV